MTIRVLFFGQLREVVGRSEETLDLPGGNLEAVFRHYAVLHPRLESMAGSIAMARNQSFAGLDEPLADGDEVAFLPPVSGGAGPWTQVVEEPEGHFFALTREPIDAAWIKQKLLQGIDGAYLCFEGVVRNNSQGRATLYLDYECYEAMAGKVMADLGRELAREFAVSRIALVHRLGRMEIGETSVVVAVAAPHRKPAYAASLEGINRLKRRVPIWKKEHFADGAVWVDGEWDDAVVKSAPQR